MGKKRKASSGPPQPKGPREYDPADARLGPINSYEDVADSEDEYFLNKDQILFDDGPKSKKQRRIEEEEEFLENSDEEALAYDDENSDDDGEGDDQDDYARKPAKPAKGRRDGGSESGQEEGEEGDLSWWGSSRKEYYNADNLETEADALEEEQEARRLQKKKLAKMSESDFIFDEAEWLAPEADDADQNEVVTEVLKDVEIPADMGVEERYRLLRTRYPEFDYLADELQQLQPLLVDVQKQAEGQPSKSLPVVKYRVLGCYVATLAMYFATLTSPARDAANGNSKVLDPAELRDHEVMGTLLECRDAWKKVENLKGSDQVRATAALPSPPEEEQLAVGEDVNMETEVLKKSNKESAKKAKAKAKAERKAKAIEESFADLDALVTTKKKAKKPSAEIATRESDSDFGEEETLDAKAAAEKAARKKSLRFYTSQIVQKANRRAGAGRDAGGDMDIPYRERLKDRQARLNLEAEKRGKMSSKMGADLGDDSDEEDAHVATAVRDDEDEYYDMIAARSSNKKEEKAARSAALAAASSRDRVVQKEEIGEDGKRKISYQIEKNKGLTPHRKKDVRNPRVKKRKAYAEKQKKLKSMKAVYKGGEGRGGYAGELTGIKPGLIKSVKLG
ncbi:Sas10 C-terminal domain-containing protein [Annulohypoxylon truncatum]|uniref:Sas10 C-terminal domain-containing protein n=1 Tax=Annulohypoxylon truncatum TaxID=327061 RepID=UPI0020082460|nr:Sas10 C-terminal domain-containing protein [Annulohypoxylon truncatum]KAI1212176.1 Sas10 C-terminal domain-containing protein [Annulohypoxylon truncatum]